MVNSSYSTASIPTIPTIDEPFVDDNGIIQSPWYRLLVSLISKTGSPYGVPNIAYIVQNADGTLSVYNAGTNVLIGNLVLP